MRPRTLLGPVERYADALSARTHGIVGAISFLTFVGVIVFGFVPVTQEIETSGYSTGDLQEATTRAEVDTILQAFESVMDAVVLLSVLDYLFIVAGFFLFFSVHSLVIKGLASHDRLGLVPQVGMVLTIASRLSDSLENLWAILIYTNPDSYATVLIDLLNVTQSVKWTLVAVEYATAGLAIVLVVLVQFTHLFQSDEGQT